MIRTALADSLRAALAATGVDAPDDIELDRPARREHGDWSTNVALVVAKAAGRNPRELAAELVSTIDADRPAHVAAVEVAGPGFVNFRLHDSWLHEVLRDVVVEGVDRYATPDIGAGSGSASSS